MSILRAVGVTKRFGRKRVLDEVDYDLAEGKVTVLLGRNGAGKSTFMKLALGVLAPDKGRLEVCGLDPVRRGRAVRQRVGYVPDKPDAYDWMTPRSLYRFLRPQYPTWNGDVVARSAASLGVPLDTPFRTLSRGEGMKAMLVAALAPQPPLLLLDEPFAGLDPLVREEVLRGVIAELRAGEHTVLCTTHDLDVAARIADQVAVVGGGTIAGRVTLDDAAQAPQRMRELLEAVS